MREYQKEAIRTVMRYLAGGEVREPAGTGEGELRQDNDELQRRYGSWTGMERHLQSA